MRKQIEERLRELQAEFEAGQKRLQELEAQAGELRTTLLRISGAIQVIQEELGKAASADSTDTKKTKESVVAMRPANKEFP